ncbi:MAG: acyl-CoA thioesterase [Robiginitomaculum sp.]|nr:acyl-CoA thioesterase [Robiginitomaculum sp.]
MADKHDTLAAYPYTLDIQTRWNDNDQYGHINNAVYYTYFDTLVNNFLIENGLLVLGESEIIGLVVETQCQYLAPTSYPETIQAGLRVGKIGNSSARYEIGLFKESDSTLIAKGYFVHVYVNEKTRRPAPISDARRDILQALHTNKKP